MKHEVLHVAGDIAPQVPAPSAEDTLGANEGVSTLEQAEAVRESLVTYLKSNRLLLNTFAEDTSLRYVIPGRAGSFAISMDTGEIHVPLEWFMKREYSKDQVLWACLHEVAHFRELIDDLEGEKNNRKHILEKAKEMAVILEKKAGERFGESDPEYVAKLKEQKDFPLIEGETISAIEKVVYDYYHTFQNVLRDVYVNSYVARKAPAYDKTLSAGKEISRLYKERLFKETDYRSGSVESKGNLPKPVEGEKGEPLEIEAIGKKSIPRHLQFVYKIIREEMVPEEEVAVDDGVLEVFSRKMKYKARSYNVKEILDAFMKPRAGRDTKLTTRTEIAAKTIETLFDELLRKDLEDLDVPEQNKKGKSGKGGEGESGQSNDKTDDKNEQSNGDSEGNEQKEQTSNADNKGDQPEADGDSPDSDLEENDSPNADDAPTDAPAESNEAPEGGSTPKDEKPTRAPEDPEEQGDSEQNEIDPFKEFYRELDENEIDQFDEKQIDDFIKKQEKNIEEDRLKKIEEETENQKKAEQKKKEFQEKLDKKFCEDNRIDLKTLQEFRAIQDLVRPYLDELSHLWDHIIYGSTKGVDYEVDGHYTSGSQLDVGKVIKDFASIQRGVSEPRVYNKRVENLVVVEKPELIRVRIVGDISGSMIDNGKSEMLRNVAVLLLSSLHEFNDRLLALKKQSGSKTWVDTEVWSFGKEGTCIKELAKRPDVSDEREVITSFHGLRADPMSGTNNTDVLEKISDSIEPQDSAKNRSGKIMDLILEVTDGIPNDQRTTVEAINKLEEQGVIIRAFQIGGNSHEVEVFNRVWNTEDKNRGFVVGNDIAQLIPAVVNSLKEHLSGIRL